MRYLNAINVIRSLALVVLIGLVYVAYIEPQNRVLTSILVACTILPLFWDFWNLLRKSTKEPNLDLQLVDPQGNAAREIYVEPTYVKVRKEIIKISDPRYLFLKVSKVTSLAAIGIFDSFAEREPAADLVPLGIEISSNGKAPAHGIAVSLEFPEECESFSKSEATGGIAVIGPRSYGGLYRDDDNKAKATAWIHDLGNDLLIRKFSPIYVRFPEKEQTHLIQANIIQHNYPPKHVECRIHVKPKVTERVEQVFEDEQETDGSRKD